MLNPFRILTLTAAAVIGARYGWKTERHPHTVKLRRVPPRPAQMRADQPTDPFPPINLN